MTYQITATQGVELEALESFMARSVGRPLMGPLSAELIRGGKSKSGTSRLTDGERRWILQWPPLGEILPGAHDVTREYCVMAALATTEVPVPTMTALTWETAILGAPFHVMEEVSGVVLRSRDQVARISAKERAGLGRSLVDSLVDLHQVDYREVGLKERGQPRGYLERQLDRWPRQFRKTKMREMPHVEEVLTALNKELPTHEDAVIVHGDYRIDNVIVDGQDPTRIAAGLDWEMATIGDPLADLAMMLIYWDEESATFNPITAGGLRRILDPVRRRRTLRRELQRRGRPSRLVPRVLPIQAGHRCGADLRKAPEGPDARIRLRGHRHDGAGPARDGTGATVRSCIFHASNLSPSIQSPGAWGSPIRREPSTHGTTPLRRRPPCVPGRGERVRRP